MRKAESRITVLLIAAISLVVAATYWLWARQEPTTQWLLLRGVLLVGGTGLVRCRWGWARSGAMCG